jgi:hypothetical protein
MQEVLPLLDVVITFGSFRVAVGLDRENLRESAPS